MKHAHTSSSSSSSLLLLFRSILFPFLSLSSLSLPFALFSFPSQFDYYRLMKAWAVAYLTANIKLADCISHSIILRSLEHGITLHISLLSLLSSSLPRPFFKKILFFFSLFFCFFSPPGHFPETGLAMVACATSRTKSDVHTLQLAEIGLKILHTK